MPHHTADDPPGEVRRREAIAFIVALATSNAVLLAAGFRPAMQKSDTKFWVITACICTAASIAALYTGTDKGKFNIQQPLVTLTLLTIGIGTVLPWLLALYCHKPTASVMGGFAISCLTFCGCMTYREEKKLEAQAQQTPGTSEQH